MKKVLSALGIVFVIFVAAIAGGIGKEVGKHMFTPDSPTADGIEKGLVQGFNKAAEQLNKDAPTMIDEETRMNKATVGPGAMLTYHYTFPNYSSDEVQSEWIRSDLRESVTSQVCNSKEMKPALQYGGTYKYSYSGNDQRVIGAFQITRTDCGYAAVSP